MRIPNLQREVQNWQCWYSEQCNSALCQHQVDSVLQELSGTTSEELAGLEPSTSGNQLNPEVPTILETPDYATTFRETLDFLRDLRRNRFGFDEPAPPEVPDKQSTKTSISDLPAVPGTTGHWQRLPDNHWQQIYCRFDTYRYRLCQTEGKKAMAERGANPPNFACGSKVYISFGTVFGTGTVLRRGFGRFSDKLRIEDDRDGTDSWIDIGRCAPIACDEG